MAADFAAVSVELAILGFFCNDVLCVGTGKTRGLFSSSSALLSDGARIRSCVVGLGVEPRDGAR